MNLKGQTGYLRQLNCVQDSFETYKTYYHVTEFECIVDVQKHEFGQVRFQNRFFKLSNNDDEKLNKNYTLN